MRAHRNHMQPLFEALEGRPTESQAVRTIVVFAVIPSTMAGLLLGAISVPNNVPFERLLLVSTIAAVGAAVTTLLMIVALHKVFGFHAVVMLTNVFLGAFGGLIVGIVVSEYIAGWYGPAFLSLAGAIIFPWFAFRRAPVGPAIADDDQTNRSP